MKLRDFISGLLVFGIGIAVLWAIGRYKEKHQYVAIQVRAKDFRLLLDTSVVKSFKTLYIQQGVIPTWLFGSDKVEITPVSVDSSNEPLGISPIFWKLSGMKFSKDKRFATYELSKDHLRQLVSIPRVLYYHLQPTVYTKDNRYIRYEITPFDSSHKAILLPQAPGVLIIDPVPPAGPYQNP